MNFELNIGSGGIPTYGILPTINTFLLVFIIIAKFWIYGRMSLMVSEVKHLLTISKEYAKLAERATTRAESTMDKIDTATQGAGESGKIKIQLQHIKESVL